MTESSPLREARGEPGQSAPPVSYPTVYVSRVQLDRTAALLAAFAVNRPREGVVYWFGLELGACSVVTTLIVPNADPRAAGVVTTPEANAEALAAIADTPLALLGQAHSHPRYDVRHSPVDDTETFARFDGALSVVVPRFGRRGLDLGRCGIYRHLDGRFCRVASEQLSRHLVVLPGELDMRRADMAGPENDRCR